MKTKFKDFINENIQTNEFKEWFGDSVMVDRNDNPSVFYHGSKHNFDTFDKNKFGTSNDPGWLGEGFYFFDNYEDASHYGKVKKYYLKIEEVYYATDEENEELSELNDKDASQEFSEMVKNNGFDGVYYNGNLRGETVVFEPEQIWEIK